MTKFGTGPGWKRVQRPLATALLCGAMLTSLTGCIELMVGGAVMSGVARAWAWACRWCSEFVTTRAGMSP